ncbi:hypothetical protein Pla144_46610 [Bythopirellula polymerisocia]|uniref:Uncharacterized protein n=1 Tax=Bythopirellula polymerisocia TaxID=2528003 RepID=A0A5C6CAZ3_9BACT|nr:hypothetical protein Pla144_46610 [Bythopirellula polymerisocia]
MERTLHYTSCDLLGSTIRANLRAMGSWPSTLKGGAKESEPDKLDYEALRGPQLASEWAHLNEGWQRAVRNFSNSEGEINS